MVFSLTGNWWQVNKGIMFTASCGATVRGCTEGQSGYVNLPYMPARTLNPLETWRLSN